MLPAPSGAPTRRSAQECPAAGPAGSLCPGRRAGMRPASQAVLRFAGRHPGPAAASRVTDDTPGAGSGAGRGCGSAARSGSPRGLALPRPSGVNRRPSHYWRHIMMRFLWGFGLLALWPLRRRTRSPACGAGLRRRCLGLLLVARGADELSSAAAESEFVSSASVDEGALGWGIYTGYFFTEILALEAGYLRDAERDISMTVSVPGGAGDVAGDMTASALYGAALVYSPLCRTRGSSRSSSWGWRDGRSNWTSTLPSPTRPARTCSSAQASTLR